MHRECPLLPTVEPFPNWDQNIPIHRLKTSLERNKTLPGICRRLPFHPLRLQACLLRGIPQPPPYPNPKRVRCSTSKRSSLKSPRPSFSVCVSYKKWNPPKAGLPMNLL